MPRPHAWPRCCRRRCPKLIVLFREDAPHPCPPPIKPRLPGSASRASRRGVLATAPRSRRRRGGGCRRGNASTSSGTCGTLHCSTPPGVYTIRPAAICNACRGAGGAGPQAGLGEVQGLHSFFFTLSLAGRGLGPSHTDLLSPPSRRRALVLPRAACRPAGRRGPRPASAFCRQPASGPSSGLGWAGPSL